MLIDTLNTFSWETAITADAISDVIDLQVVSGSLNAGDTGGPSANTIRDIGAGEPLYLHILVTTALVSAGGGTLTVALESDSAAALNASATVHMTVASAVAAATMVAGYWIAKGVAIPSGAYERYLGLRYTTNTADFETGKVSAWLSTNRYDDRTYESGSTTGVN
jgi:hypothetical protein